MKMNQIIKRSAITPHDIFMMDVCWMTFIRCAQKPYPNYFKEEDSEKWIKQLL